MNSQVRLNQTSAVTAPSQGGGSGPSDAELQALLELGELQYLANTYLDLVNNKGSPQPLTNETLAQFQKLYALFHFTKGPGGAISVTFDYNEGAQKGVPITDPDILEIFQHIPMASSNPPSAADLTAFQTALYSTTTITWSDGQQQTILERMLLELYDAQYTMAEHPQSTITNTALLLFYLSIVNSPGNIAAGTLDDLLSVGYYDGSMFYGGNIRAIAQTLKDHFANDSFLSSDVILAGLQIETKDNLYPQLGQYFQSDTEDGSQEAQDWDWQSRFFPYNDDSNSPKTINALPDRENSYLENQIELEKKAMKKKETPDATPHRIQSE